MISPSGGGRTLLQVAVGWGIGCLVLVGGMWLADCAVGMPGLMGLSYASMVVALAFTLYGLAIAPHPFSWKSLLAFDAFMLLVAALGATISWILIHAVFVVDITPIMHLFFPV